MRSRGWEQDDDGASDESYEKTRIGKLISALFELFTSFKASLIVHSYVFVAYAASRTTL